MAILTISREYGSGGREIGLEIARILKYDYIDKERLIGDIRASGNKWEEWSKNLDEHCPTVWEKYDWSFRGFSALLQSHLLNYALKDNVVIMGRGGNFLLKDIPYALRLRVIAPLDQRIERIMKRESVNMDNAKWLSEKTDRERGCLIHLMYGKHWDDAKEYDMVFDTEILTINEIAKKTMGALLERNKLKTTESEEILRMLAKAASIKADILIDHGIFIPTLDVYYDIKSKSIIMRGVTHNPKEHKKIEDRARALAGEIPLKCELHYRR